MPDWSNPHEIAKDGGKFWSLCFVCTKFLTFFCLFAYDCLHFLLHFPTITLDGRFWYPAEIFQKLIMVMLGWSTWEIIIQLPFDWSIISRKVRLVLSFYSLRQTHNLTANMHPLSIHWRGWGFTIGVQQRKARWPVFFYFYCKYAIWVTVIGIVIATNATTKINCQAIVRALHIYLSHPQTDKFPLNT